MTPEALTETIAAALQVSARAGVCLPQVHIERPSDRRHGDWSSSIALRAAKPLCRDARELADELARTLNGSPGVATVEVAGPGFLNVTLDASEMGELARTIVESGDDYGRSATFAGCCVKAAPVTPAAEASPLMTARAVAVRDSLMRIVVAAGADSCADEEVEGAALLLAEADPGMQLPQPVQTSGGTAVNDLDDLVSLVGQDAARYAFVRTATSSALHLDLDQLRRRTADNPVFAVQFAHARTCVAAERAAAAGVRREDGFAPELLTHASETVLLAGLGDYPRVVAQAAQRREPRRVARYLEELAAAYHGWQDTLRIRPDAFESVTDVHRTRLWLNAAVGHVLAAGLGLLGVGAPRRL